MKTKQDPFHVIPSFKEENIEKTQRKSLSKQLSNAMYDIGSGIRTPDTMADRMKTTLQRVDLSNVRYIERGKHIRVVSTSQLETVHSKLRKMLDRIVSFEVGMRILDIFLLKTRLT
ncbi:hypothetical protein PHMEG_0006780 [Phytophthora megakarya]|uniref:Uncharacterized protein n=1 Tax=Phytophthora megakarya TaxID=4795 RepID=A0A225WNF0_9STRA|nr:hypothetical protein PHMEG_0006780 [Phytophthora megakarya]